MNGPGSIRAYIKTEQTASDEASSDNMSSGGDDSDAGGNDKKPGGGGGGGHKRMSVERIYQKKTPHEHILLRPDTYIGSVESVTQQMWVYDGPEEGLVLRDITFVPGLYKIFDEILVNAADNKQKCKSMDAMKIDIDPEKNEISIWNNGEGIPVVEHKDEKMYVPTLIFGHLLTSSNYNDEEKKVTGGRNGYGAKLCNIFSTRFAVETSSKSSGKMFKQVWKNNMTVAGEPIVKAVKGADYTKITFSPDLAKFKMESLDKDMVALMSRRALDVAGSTRNVKVYLNGTRLPIKNFKDYVDLYTKDKVDEGGNALKVVYEICDRWEVAATVSDRGYQQVSFVNSIATTKGGKHADHVTDQIVNKIIEIAKKKTAKSAVTIRPSQVKTHIWVFINCLIENPTFDSQTKEHMTLQIKSFGSKCTLSDKFIAGVQKSGVVEAVRLWADFKSKINLDKKCSSNKLSKLKGLPKLEDANDAGTKRGVECTLILTEGDSAKTVAVTGLGVIGRDRFGVFPLKGKILNVRDATQKQVLDNAEINNIIKIVGLQYKKKYVEEKDLASLRYGHIMIMTDQDQDGSHIKGLLINFIHHNWPGLLQTSFLEQFITPIVKVKPYDKAPKEETLAFYSLPEYEEWKKSTPNWFKWKAKYYKGLGTNDAKEAKDLFVDMERHRITFKYKGHEDDTSIQLAFGKDHVEQRKEWLDNFLQERRRRRELGLSDHYLYGKNTRTVSYSDFINKELILFSNMDNERSIPHIMDGLKPGNRKVIFGCLKKNLVKEVKVATLGGAIMESTAYHHGDASIQGNIVNLAQNFVGSNNINLLVPSGQFGTRLMGGKDAASPRYIATYLSPLAFHIFNKLDTPLLNTQTEDNLSVEPEFYVPIIPMVLVNGADGIGTGWSTKIPNYNPREIVANLKLLLNDEEPVPMKPWFKHFDGSIVKVSDNCFSISGEIAVVDEKTVDITELPVRVWTQTYKEKVMDPFLHGIEKSSAEKAADKADKAVKEAKETKDAEKLVCHITDYKEYHTDTKVRFLVTMTPEKLRKAESEGFHKFFKLQTSMAISCMVLFDSKGVLRRYDSVEDILKEFYTVRLDYYERRKKYLIGFLDAEARRLDNQARFILEKISGQLSIENKKVQAILDELVSKKYDPDPVKVWKESQLSELARAEQAENDNEPEKDDKEPEDNSGGQEKSEYDYLMTLHMWHLTMERKNALLAQRDAKYKEVERVRKLEPKKLWLDDLDAFLKALDKVEAEEKSEETGDKSATKKKSAKSEGKSIKKGKGAKGKVVNINAPPLTGTRVEPKMDADLMKRLTAAKTAKPRKKKENSFNTSSSKTDTQEDSDGEIKPLAERLNVKSKLKTTGAKKDPSGLKQTKLNFPKSVAGKKKKKKNSSSTEEESSLSDVSDMFDDSDESDRAPPKPKVTSEADQSNLFDSLLTESPETAMAAPAPRLASSSNGNNNNNGVLTISSDSDSVAKPAKVKKALPAKKRALPKPSSRGSSDDDHDRKEPKRKKPAAAPKRKPKFQDSSDSDASLDELIPKSVKNAPVDLDSDFEGAAAAKSRSARAKPAVKYTFDDDSDSD